jgi:hypothetical protein
MSYPVSLNPLPLKESYAMEADLWRYLFSYTSPPSFEKSLIDVERDYLDIHFLNDKGRELGVFFQGKGHIGSATDPGIKFIRLYNSIMKQAEFLPESWNKEFILKNCTNFLRAVFSKWEKNEITKNDYLSIKEAFFKIIQMVFFEGQISLEFIEHIFKTLNQHCLKGKQITLMNSFLGEGKAKTVFGVSLAHLEPTKDQFIPRNNSVEREVFISRQSEVLEDLEYISLQANFIMKEFIDGIGITQPLTGELVMSFSYRLQFSSDSIFSIIPENFSVSTIVNGQIKKHCYPGQLNLLQNLNNVESELPEDPKKILDIPRGKKEQLVISCYPNDEYHFEYHHQPGRTVVSLKSIEISPDVKGFSSLLLHRRWQKLPEEHRKKYQDTFELILPRYIGTQPDLLEWGKGVSVVEKNLAFILFQQSTLKPEENISFVCVKEITNYFLNAILKGELMFCIIVQYAFIITSQGFNTLCTYQQSKKLREPHFRFIEEGVIAAFLQNEPQSQEVILKNIKGLFLSCIKYNLIVVAYLLLEELKQMKGFPSKEIQKEIENLVGTYELVLNYRYDYVQRLYGSDTYRIGINYGEIKQNAEKLSRIWQQERTNAKETEALGMGIFAQLLYLCKAEEEANQQLSEISEEKGKLANARDQMKISEEERVLIEELCSIEKETDAILKTLRNEWLSFTSYRESYEPFYSFLAQNLRIKGQLDFCNIKKATFSSPVLSRHLIGGASSSPPSRRSTPGIVTNPVFTMDAERVMVPSPFETTGARQFLHTVQNPAQQSLAFFRQNPGLNLGDQKSISHIKSADNLLAARWIMLIKTLEFMVPY